MLAEQVFTSQGELPSHESLETNIKRRRGRFLFFRKGAEWYTGEIYRVVIKIPSTSWSRNDENNLERGGFLLPIFLAARSPTQIGIFSWEASIIANYTCSTVQGGPDAAGIIKLYAMNESTYYNGHIMIMSFIFYLIKVFILIQKIYFE